RGAGDGGASGCFARKIKSPFPVQHPAHAGRPCKVPAGDGRGRDRTPRRYAALYAQGRWPGSGRVRRGIRIHATVLAFEQLRYEDRLKLDMKIDPECFNFEIPPFSMQTLAENAVRHAISVRPEGGALCIACTCRDDMMTVTVRDDGPGGGADLC